MFTIQSALCSPDLRDVFTHPEHDQKVCEKFSTAPESKEMPKNRSNVRNFETHPSFKIMKFSKEDDFDDFDIILRDTNKTKLISFFNPTNRSTINSFIFIM